MTARLLATPLGPALAQAQAALIAAPAGTADDWVIPDGVHALPAIALGAPGRSLVLRGSDQVTLTFAAGGLAVTGDAVELRELRVRADAAVIAVAVTAGRIAVSDLEVVRAAGADVTAVALDAGDGGTVFADDVEVTEVSATGSAVGVTLHGGDVRAARVIVGRAAGARALGVRVLAVRDAAVSELTVGGAAGDGVVAIALAALGDLDASRLTASKLTGRDATAIAIAASGAEARVVGIDVRSVIAPAGRAIGAIAIASGDLAVRGLAIEGVSGPSAIGLVAAGGGRDDGRRGPAVEVGFGTIRGVTASGGTAAGARVLAAGTRREVVVRDLAITAIEVDGAAPIAGTPALATPPGPAWTAWAIQAIADRSAAVAPAIALPALPADPISVGLHVNAVIEQVTAFADRVVGGDLIVADSAIRHVHGDALVVEAGQRAAMLRRVEVATAVRGGYLQGDRLLIVNTTWHRLGAAIAIGPGELRAFDSVFSGIAQAGDPLVLDVDADWVAGGALYARDESLGFAPLGPLPYRVPGPVALPAAWSAGKVAVPDPADLRLVASSELHRAAIAPPPDELDRDDPGEPYVGAHPPEPDARCRLYDPMPRAIEPVPGPQLPGPVIDYRARDAEALLAVMLARAEGVMPPWTDRGAADLTTMVLETVAERLDHLSYQQERAVSEGFLEDARLRRSVEDHVRPLDYPVDPGLSATTMLQFTIDFSALADLQDGDSEVADAAALRELARDRAIEIPAGALAGNASDEQALIVFATESPLVYAEPLERIALVEPVRRGATSARLDVVHAALARDRWLVVMHDDGRGHVVRVTRATAGSRETVVAWDPRRPMPFDLERGAGVVLGNVVPAHHGLPVAALAAGGGPGSAAESEVARAAEDPVIAQLTSMLTITARGDRELNLPLFPISIHAAGYPLPGQVVRRGRPQLQVTVDGDQWRQVDDLAIQEPGDEVFALRTSADGRAAIRFGDGEHGAALPRVEVAVALDPTIGAGAAGNIGARVLRRLLGVPRGRAAALDLGELFRLDPEAIRRLLAVENPLPAIGGRDPEPIDRVRYRAPLVLARPLSAVTPADYVRVARGLPEVAAADARMVPGPIRPVIRVTVLLADEDTLDDSERLRRWSVVRKALEDARLVGFDVETVPPRWVPLDLDVVVDAAPHAEAGAVRDAVIASIAGDGGLLDPDTGRLGGDVQLADLYRAALRPPGVIAARVKRFRRLGAGMPERLADGVIAIGSDEVAIVRGPGRPRAGGVLTVTVCGGLV